MYLLLEHVDVENDVIFRTDFSKGCRILPGSQDLAQHRNFRVALYGGYGKILLYYEVMYVY